MHRDLAELVILALYFLLYVLLLIASIYCYIVADMTDGIVIVLAETSLETRE